MIEFILNDRKVRTGKPTGSLLLDFVRYDQRLTGTKIGCREGDCGACNLLIGEVVNGQMQYEQVTSCLTPIGNAHGKHIVTVEGLNMEDLSPAQQFMVDEAGTQCGICTVGFVVSLSAFCLANEVPTYQNAIAAVDGNICRCTGYKSIERAAKHLTDKLQGKNTSATIDWLVDNGFIPAYFKNIQQKLDELKAPFPVKSNGVMVGGGTDLYVQRPGDLVELEVGLAAADPGLRFTRVKDGICFLGGGSTVTDFQRSPEIQAMFPRLMEHIKLVSSSPIRNISTMAGNFVNASPIGDFTAFFLALNSRITLSENGSNRTIYLKDFYKGYKDLDKTKGEIITEISFKVPSVNAHFNLEKVCKRIHLDIASVNTAAQIEVESDQIVSAHISAGGVSPIPLYLRETSSFLPGKELNGNTVKAANKIMQAEISPISDVRGTADYKRLLLRQLFFAHFIKLFPNHISLEGLQ